MAASKLILDYSYCQGGNIPFQQPNTL